MAADGWLPAPGAVIFDCDGTLCDSEPLAHIAWTSLLTGHGYTLTEEDMRICLGRSYVAVRDHYASRVPELASAEELWPAFSTTMNQLIINHLRPFADAVDTAQRLATRGVPLAVATSSPRTRLTVTLAALGLTTLFPVSVAGDEVTEAKPAPDLFLAAARRLGLPPAACLVIEDSQPGVLAARAAGMTVIGVQRMAGADIGDADAVVPRLTETVIDSLWPARCLP